MNKRLDTHSQEFLAFCICRGVQLADVYMERSGFLCFALDDSDGLATQVLDDWRADRVLVSAKTYAAAFRSVIRTTSEFRKNNAGRTTAATEGVFTNDHARTAAR